MLQAALAGEGLAYLSDITTAEAIATGRLTRAGFAGDSNYEPGTSAIPLSALRSGPAPKSQTLPTKVVTPRPQRKACSRCASAEDLLNERKGLESREKSLGRAVAQ